MSQLPRALGLAAGVALDALLGDPRRGHPVAAFGRAAAALEQRDYADSRARGLAHVAVCVGAVAAPAALLQHRLRGLPLLEFTAVAATAWAVTGARSLRHVSERAVVALTADDLPAAREVLPSLCGRDPSGLGSKEIARAVIESVAENTSDAVVAPLLWGAAAGLPGLVAYRAINTLDAMIGHHSPRYERFGWAAARLDDVANWIPSRVTALLAVACAPTRASTPTRAFAPTRAPHRVNCAVEPARACQRGDSTAALDAWRAWRRYGAQHPSPNAGQCESAFAGALGVRLGGTNVYHGVPETRPELGDGRPPEPADIRHAIRLSRNISIAAAAVAALVATAKARLKLLWVLPPPNWIALGLPVCCVHAPAPVRRRQAGLVCGMRLVMCEWSAGCGTVWKSAPAWKFNPRAWGSGHHNGLIRHVITAAPRPAGPQPGGRPARLASTDPG